MGQCKEYCLSVKRYMESYSTRDTVSICMMSATCTCPVWAPTPIPPTPHSISHTFCDSEILWHIKISLCIYTLSGWMPPPPGYSLIQRGHPWTYGVAVGSPKNWSYGQNNLENWVLWREKVTSPLSKNGAGPRTLLSTRMSGTCCGETPVWRLHVARHLARFITNLTFTFILRPVYQS